MIYNNKRSLNLRKNWIKHEKHIMKMYGLKPSPGSGNTELLKEDGESDKLLAQLKSTEGKAISFKKRDILELIKNAWIAHKKPVFMFDFMSDNEDLIFIAIRPFDLMKVANEFQKLSLRKGEK